eukprot:15338603-Ditylum_brightwellii.AAC.1
MSIDISTIRVPVFDGEMKNFQSWWIRFQKGLAVASGDGNQDSSGKDVLSIGIDLDKSYAKGVRILEDPNVFAGDTGANSDATNSRYGFTNIRKATKRDSTVDALENNISGRILGDVCGNIYSKTGQELKDLSIKDMMHISGSGYTLFILTKHLD